MHVANVELGGGQQVALRGSPFMVQAADPWVKHGVQGELPIAKRKVGFCRMRGGCCSELCSPLTQWRCSGCDAGLGLPHFCWLPYCFFGCQACCRFAHRLRALPSHSTQGATLVAMGGELVLWGGAAGAGLAVASRDGGNNWRWAAAPVTGDVAPRERSQHSAVTVGWGTNQSLVVFGGLALEDNNELGDMFWLKKQAGTAGWAWGCPKSALPYARCVVAGGCCQSGREEGAFRPLEAEFACSRSCCWRVRRRGSESAEELPVASRCATQPCPLTRTCTSLGATRLAT